jgi:hypothetical protein
VPMSVTCCRMRFAQLAPIWRNSPTESDSLTRKRRIAGGTGTSNKGVLTRSAHQDRMRRCNRKSL